MSLLHPGGFRGRMGQVGHRLFNAKEIVRGCKQAMKGRDHVKRARGSISTGNRHGGPHQHKREIARRVRQAAAAGKVQAQCRKELSTG